MNKKNDETEQSVPKRRRGAQTRPRLPGTIGYRVYQTRSSLSLSLEQFSALTNVRTATLYLIERNKSYPNIKTLQKISHATGVSLTYLISG